MASIYEQNARYENPSRGRVILASLAGIAVGSVAGLMYGGITDHFMTPDDSLRTDVEVVIPQGSLLYTSEIPFNGGTGGMKEKISYEDNDENSEWISVNRFEMLLYGTIGAAVGKKASGVRFKKKKLGTSANR